MLEAAINEGMGTSSLYLTPAYSIIAYSTIIAWRFKALATWVNHL